MANPKRRTSKRRYRTRRASQKAPLVALNECPNCKASRVSHQVCPECGHYKGRQVFSVE